MYAANNKAMENVVNKVYEYNSDETMQDICRVREESIAYQKFVDNRTKRMEEALVEKEKALAEMDEALAEKNEALAEKDAELIAAKKLIAELQARINK